MNNHTEVPMHPVFHPEWIIAIQHDNSLAALRSGCTVAGRRVRAVVYIGSKCDPEWLESVRGRCDRGGWPALLTFRQWLSDQIGKDSPTGDVALDAFQDDGWTLDTVDSLHHRMSGLGADGAALRALSAASDEWAATSRPR